MKYSEGFRASIVKKTQDGSGRTIYQIAKETGVNAVTIQNWLTKFKNGRLNMDGCDAVTPSQRNPGEKLSLLLESQNLTDEMKGEWLRQHGLHSEPLQLCDAVVGKHHERQTNRFKVRKLRIKKGK